MITEGSRVICTRSQDGNRKIVGKTGTVLYIDNFHTCTVEFDVDIGGHDGDGKGKYYHCWMITPGKLSLVSVDVGDLEDDF